MSRKTEYFICVGCGEEKARSEKPSSHRAHGVNECSDCYSKKKGAEIVEKARRKKAEHAERIAVQQAEREAKRKAIEAGIAAKKTPTKLSKKTAATKARMDKHLEDKENKLINGDYEL